VDGVPTLGWADTSAFLILPVALVLSQFASMELMQPKPVDGAEPAASNPVLKLLPLMIGWFSLNVPAALTVYWVTNNIITTSSSLYIRNSISDEPAVSASSSSTSTIDKESPAKGSMFSAPREKPSGFSAPSFSRDDIKPITSSAIDAEVVDDEEEDGDDDEGAAKTSSDEGAAKKSKSKKGKKRGSKKN
jgi:YidC/Oxa1 family membrane protein insertase